MKSFCIAIISLVLLFTESTAQVNYLNVEDYGMEEGSKAFWIQHNQWAVTNEKAASGQFSIKYSSNVSVNENKKAHGAEISLKAGTYTMKLKVWHAEDSELTGFTTTFKQDWKQVSWNLDTVKHGQWVELSQEITFDEDLIDSGFLLIVGESHNGKGTLYIDDIQIWGEAKNSESSNIPFATSIRTINNGKVSLPEGDYNVTVGIYVTDTTNISRFYTQIEEPFKNLEWSLDTLVREQWVEVSQQIQFNEDVEQSSFKLYVCNHPDFGGGKGTFYVDDIRFILNTTVNLEIPTVLNFNVYPNPTSDYINLVSDQPGHYKLYSINGQLVKSGKMDKTRFIIPVFNFKPGTYLLQVNTEKGKMVKQIVIG